MKTTHLPWRRIAVTTLGVLVATGFITTVVLGGQHRARQDTATAAAVTTWLTTTQGKHVDNVECTGGGWSCVAILDGTTYDVTVQHKTTGRPVYGLSLHRTDN